MDFSIARTSCNSDTMIITSESSPESSNPTKNMLNFSVDRLLSCDRDYSDKQDNNTICTSPCNNSISKCHQDELTNSDETGNRVIRPMPIRIAGSGREHRGTKYISNITLI